MRFFLVDRIDSKIDSKTFGTEEDDWKLHQPGGLGTHWSGILAGYHGFVDSLERLVLNKEKDLYPGHDELCRFYTEYLDDKYSIS